jgi:endonuclease/exonuclease/phosphatase family metal-dependent hydrolase
MQDNYLRIATYNIHKGMSLFNRRHMLHELKAALEELRADLIFLQEVQGEHRIRARDHHDWPDQPQHIFLAADHHHAYGRNAEYRAGHHGNAFLSRYPIVGSHNEDVSLNRLERRGLLHSEVAIDAWAEPLHCVCVHLNLRASDRRKQLAALSDYVSTHVPPSAPLIIAGDFNDWRGEACAVLHHLLGVEEAFTVLHGQPVASFPARFPMLALDRIYLRGLHAQQAQVHTGTRWRGLSDHAPLSALVRRH